MLEFSLPTLVINLLLALSLYKASKSLVPTSRFERTTIVHGAATKNRIFLGE